MLFGVRGPEDTGFRLALAARPPARLPTSRLGHEKGVEPKTAHGPNRTPIMKLPQRGMARTPSP